MEVILLERVAKLGQMGEVVRVKDGYARNFLLPRGKALRATADNRAKFDGMKAELEARNLEAKGEATKVAEKIDGRNVVVLRQASETGQLFGSVTVRDIIASFEADGVTISRSQVMLDAPIKTIGKHKIAIAVHPEVEVSVSVTVARSADEAERINRGEDISTRKEDQDAAAEALAAAGEFFDPEARRDDVPAGRRRFREVTPHDISRTRPGHRPGFGFGRLFVEHGDRGQRGCGVFSSPSITAASARRRRRRRWSLCDAPRPITMATRRTVGAAHREGLAVRLDSRARGRSGAFAGRRRQQVQFVFRRQRRLAARRRRRDRGRVVDQEAGDAAMKQPVLLQQFRPPVDASVPTHALASSASTFPIHAASVTEPSGDLRDHLDRSMRVPDRGIGAAS